MLILLVDAFSSSRSGRAAFQKFDRLVRSAFASVERHEQGRNQYIVRHFMRGLEDLCYDNESVGLASRSTIVAVDKLDFVFVDGDSRLLPWNVRTRKLVIFLRNVLGAKKCLFASGPAALIVAYVCATGGRSLTVLNGNGNGGSLLDLFNRRPRDLGGSEGKARSGGGATEVALDSTTGDFYAFDFTANQWMAEGNVGVQKTDAGIGGVAAAILADCSGPLQGSGRTRKVPVNELLGFKRTSQGAADISTAALRRPNTPRVQSEVLVKVRPKSIQHALLKQVERGEFIAWGPGRWSLGEKTTVHCRRTFKVLASSARSGPEVVEVGNCVATRFSVRKAYSGSVGLLQAFVTKKHGLIREKSRIDRSCAFVLDGSAGDDMNDAAEYASREQSALQHSRAGLFKSRRRHTRHEGAAEAEPSSAKTSPHRPKLTEKARFAPPQCTRPIGVAPPSRERTPERTWKRDGATVTTGKGCLAGNSSVRHDEVYISTFAYDEASHCGRFGPERRANPVARRRVLMANIGQRVGLDLSPTFDALTLEGDVQGRATACGDPPDTARTVPASYFSESADFDTARDGFDRESKPIVRSGAPYPAGRCNAQVEEGRMKLCCWDDTTENLGADISISSAHPPLDEGKNPARVNGNSSSRRRRTAAQKVRVPGLGYPYSNYHRYETMARETRPVFFSLTCNSSSAKENDHATRFVDETEWRTGDPKPSFRTAFGGEGGWRISQEFQAAGEEPWVQKKVGILSCGEPARHLFLDPMGWRRSGAKTRAWSGIGEGIVQAK